jgi:hypothetical protein
MARKKKVPSLIVTLVNTKNPDKVVSGTFMGKYDDNMVMLGSEEQIDMFSLDEHLIFYIEEYPSGNHTYPSAMEDEQEVAREILDHVNSLMPKKGV